MTEGSTHRPRFASVPIVVSDRAASKRWYTEKFGLELVDDEDHWVTVGRKGGGTVIHLCQASENQPKPIPMEPGPWGYVFALPGDFRAACDRLAKAGVEFTTKPTEAPWGWYAVVADPDRNELYLCPDASA